jgi:Ca2+-binding EF-hand superfamily protein
MSTITDDQLRNYIDHIFMRYDRDRSGTLSSNELVFFFNDLFQMMNNPRRVNQWEAQ